MRQKLDTGACSAATTSCAGASGESARRLSRRASIGPVSCASNATERPPVTSRDGSRVLHEGRAFPHFNEADEGVAVDALITDRV